MSSGPIRPTGRAHTTLRRTRLCRDRTRPLVHCLEGVDQRPGVPFGELTLPYGSHLAERHEPELLGGVTVVTADGPTRGGGDAVRLTAVPYYAWANRRPGPTRVWTAES
jgi:DUF1680 family protein